MITLLLPRVSGKEEEKKKAKERKKEKRTKAEKKKEKEKSKQNVDSVFARTGKSLATARPVARPARTRTGATPPLPERGGECVSVCVC